MKSVSLLDWIAWILVNNFMSNLKKPAQSLTLNGLFFIHYWLSRPTSTSGALWACFMPVCYHLWGLWNCLFESMCFVDHYDNIVTAWTSKDYVQFNITHIYLPTPSAFTLIYQGTYYDTVCRPTWPSQDWNISTVPLRSCIKTNINKEFDVTPQLMKFGTVLTDMALRYMTIAWNHQISS